jgi:[acyl-carrier-protein] S-malonyltransferase
MIAWIFPGQGSQAAGMAAKLESPAAFGVFESAGEAIGWNVRAACVEWSDEQLAPTVVAQPAILATSLAAAATLAERGLQPDLVAGHSVGELAALVVAGCLEPRDACRLVGIRATAMAGAGEAQAGSMAAILGLDPETVADLCASAIGEVVVANINAPGQVVVSGESAAVAIVCASARAAGARRVIPLNVSVAAHSPAMRPAEDALRDALGGVEIRAPHVPFFSCSAAARLHDPRSIAASLAAGITRPVRWTETVGAMTAAGADHFVEVGPGEVLTGLIRRIAPDARTAHVGSDAEVESLALALEGASA